MSWRWLLDARPTIIKIIKDHHTYVIVRRPNVLDGPTMTLVTMTLLVGAVACHWVTAEGAPTC